MNDLIVLRSLNSYFFIRFPSHYQRKNQASLHSQDAKPARGKSKIARPGAESNQTFLFRVDDLEKESELGDAVKSYEHR